MPKTKNPLTANRTKGKLPSCYWQKCCNFHPFSLKHWVSVYIYSKAEQLWKIFKTLSRSSHIFALSNHTNFSQTQTSATIPLNGFLWRRHVLFPSHIILIFISISVLLDYSTATYSTGEVFLTQDHPEDDGVAEDAGHHDEREGQGPQVVRRGHCLLSAVHTYKQCWGLRTSRIRILLVGISLSFLYLCFFYIKKYPPGSMINALN